MTLILYFHPSTTNAISFYRTVAVLPEGSGRVEEIYVGVRDKVKAGQPIFRLDDAEQKAALETARRRLTEIDADIRLAEAQLVVSDAQISEAESAYRQAVDELATKTELRERNSPSVAPREIERLQNLVDGRQAGVAGAIASKQTIEAQIASVLPAQKASAEAQVAEAQVELDKTIVHAGVDGILEQFTLRKGDVVNPLMRPAGVLIPEEAGRWGLIAGFNQLEAQVMKCRHGGGGHLPVDADDDHPDGGHQRPGPHRDRPGAGFGSADRCPAGGAARHADGLSRAVVRQRLRGYPARQQLHRQRLYEQPRPHRVCRTSAR